MHIAGCEGQGSRAVDNKTKPWAELPIATDGETRAAAYFVSKMPVTASGIQDHVRWPGIKYFHDGWNLQSADQVWKAQYPRDQVFQR